MAKTHIVKKGDTLWRIAKKYNFTHWKTIYNHGKNAEFRQKRPNPNRIYPGDEIHIPDKEPKEQNGETDKTHKFKVELPRVLQIAFVDDHFAPSKERLYIQYDIHRLADKTVKLQIESEEYQGTVLYERELGEDLKKDGRHTIKWDGRANKGKLDKKFINPLFAPYKVKLSSSTGEKDEEEFKVLFHSIKIEKGTYTEDGKAPDKAELVKWVQFKLNELGCFSGPVDGIKGPQTKRALQRYTYAMAGNYGNPPKKAIDDENDATLQAQLDRGDATREIIESNKLPEKGKKKKAYIDHDYFYHEYSVADFSHAQGHCNKDKTMLDRFEIPLEVKVYLVSKEDPDGTKKGRNAPGGIGEADIEWIVKDPIEDTSFLPTSTADIPSRGQQYVDAALDAIGRDKGKPEDSQDNCPKSIKNGQRDKTPRYFRLGDKLLPFKSESAGDKVYSKVHQDSDASPNKIGRSGVLFRGSYLSGDNFAFHARISFERLGNKDKLKKLHEDFTKKKLEEILFDETGEITLWRRHHVAAVVNWPDPSRGINWGDIADAYEIAHCHLDRQNESYAIEDLLATDADKNAYLDLLANRYPAYKRADMTFDGNGLYPLALPSQGLREDPKDYKSKIWNLISTFTGSADFQDDLALLLYSKVAEKRPAGIIAFRPNWARPVKVRNLLPLIRVLNPLSSEEYLPGFMCLGLPAGVALLDNGMTHEEQDGFLYAHEMGHCRYLLHHQTDNNVHDPTSANFNVPQYDTPDDHDTADDNCTMCYPQGIANRPANLTWNKGDSTEPRFCGKCVLKLRGWDVRNGSLPASS
ncbi:LysM peptidoglycan-binding domain-containing protein [Acidobacteriota bacterium]